MNSVCVQLNHVHSYKEAVEQGDVYIFIVHQYMESTCTVACAILCLGSFCCILCLEICISLVYTQFIGCVSGF